jgi:hypothetical protein
MLLKPRFYITNLFIFVTFTIVFFYSHRRETIPTLVSSQKLLTSGGFSILKK